MQRVVFLDDPANQGFFIILSHITPDGRQWFSRTRFSRKPIDAVLKSADSTLQASLVPIASEIAAGSSETSAHSVAGQSNVAGATSAVRTTKRWYRRGQCRGGRPAHTWLDTIRRESREPCLLCPGADPGFVGTHHWSHLSGGQDTFTRCRSTAHKPDSG